MHSTCIILSRPHQNPLGCTLLIVSFINEETETQKVNKSVKGTQIKSLELRFKPKKFGSGVRSLNHYAMEQLICVKHFS